MPTPVFAPCAAIKNRFGAVNELGVFAMTEQGLREVSNPSAIFLSRGDEVTSGSSVMVVWEGTRPLLVEIQALVDHSMMANPRRVAVGLEQNRLAILLAVLHRHGGLQMGRSGCICERGRWCEGNRNQCRLSVTAGDGFQPA
ncbi:putative ATP-dependent serine protease [Escherichia coli]|uniref:Putative ATP-dependent serine protease n=1 Tax=Escherichia coli TaxID=562 RepID=A0A3S4KCI3_ECOLX|nr:putative ATP-dependent serine protease [Escherichia coli]